MCTPISRAQTGFQWPDEDPENWLLAFIDVETTGLIPGYHEMIDIGLILTDLEGGEIGRTHILIQPDYPERAAEEAIAVNAFDPDLWKQRGALSPAEAVDSLFRFHARLDSGRHVMIVAFNSQFDTAFLDHLMRSEGRSWRELYHYYVLDIPSMAWAQDDRRLTGSKIAKRLGVEDEPHEAELHTGITGAALNLRIYRALLAHSVEIRAWPKKLK